jgi:2TM domain
VTAVIPLNGDQLGHEPTPRAAVPQHQRIRNLRIRLASLGLVAGVLVVIWALTGPDLPWIVWPLLALGLIAGLDAWHIHATAPQFRGRRLRHIGGSLVILNVYIVGVWAAAGVGNYFWPAWVMLGSGIVFGLSALVHRGRHG